MRNLIEDIQRLIVSQSLLPDYLMPQLGANDLHILSLVFIVELYLQISKHCYVRAVLEHLIL